MKNPMKCRASVRGCNHEEKTELTEEQQKEKEINELIMTEDNIEMTAHLEHCPECQQGGVNGMLKIFSLIGCDIYDEHEEESEDFEDEEDISHDKRQKM